jgi:type I restriction enzyme S subunit
MNKLSYLEKLLDGAEVEWKPLGDVAKVKHGKDWKNLDFGDIPVYGSGGVMGYVNKYSYNKPTVLIPRKGSITNIFYLEKPFWNVDTMYYTEIDSSQIVPKFLYHYIKTIDLMSLDTGSGRPSLTQAILNPIQIPIPCPENQKKSLAIQAEIVRILDAFTQLTAELTAELTARKKQYDYYREQLLTFKDGEVEWKTLGEVFHMRAGQQISASQIMENASTEYPYPCFGGNGIRGFVKEKSHEGKYLLIGRQGALCGNIQRTKGKLYATEHAVVVTARNEVNVDWAFHILTAMNLNQYASQAAQPGLAVGKLQSLKIPLPSIDKQIRDASILDKFDTLTTSLSEGLPREIELRKKQYEYYRDLLLSFPKPVEGAIR